MYYILVDGEEEEEIEFNKHGSVVCVLCSVPTRRLGHEVQTTLDIIRARTKGGLRWRESCWCCK